MAVLLALCAPATAQRTVSVLQILDVKTGSVTTVQEFPYLIEAPNWTVDGRWLVYNSGGKIYRISPDGGEPTLIDTGEVEGCNNDHVLSADGRQLAVSGSSRSQRGSRIYVLPLEGGTPRLVTPQSPSYLHGWSPDGKTLCYCALRDGEYDIYTIPAEGGQETRLTTAEGLDDGPEYSPDGKYIWFNSVRSGLMQVFRMKADGSQQKQMTFDDDLNSWFPHVSPNGKNVAFIAYHKGDLQPNEHLANKNVVLRVMTSKGRKLRTVHTLFGGQGTINVNSWAPDSRRLAFVSYRLEKEAHISIFCDHIGTMASQEKISFAEAAKQIKDAGCHGADVRVLQNPEHLRILDSLGFEHASAITDIDYGREGWEKVEEQTIAFMKEHDFSRVLIVPALIREGTDEAGVAAIRSRIAAFAARLSAQGLDPLVEDYDNPRSICYNTVRLDELFAVTPDLGLVFDTGNFIYCGDDTLESLGHFQGRTRHFHLKDRAAPDNMTCVPIGTGCAPIEETVSRMVKSGYDGYFTVEQYGSRQMLQDCLVSIRNIRGYIRSAR